MRIAGQQVLDLPGSQAPPDLEVAFGLPLLDPGQLGNAGSREILAVLPSRSRNRQQGPGSFERRQLGFVDRGNELLDTEARTTPLSARAPVDQNRNLPELLVPALEEDPDRSVAPLPIFDPPLPRSSGYTRIGSSRPPSARMLSANCSSSSKWLRG